MDNRFLDILSESTQLNVIAEAEGETSEVDGEVILAKVRGPFFCPDSVSRNRRYYSKSLWEKVLASPDVLGRLKDRTMFGTISHDTPLNDVSLRDGKFSHIVTKLWIDENGQGMGEALILNTPSGKILNTVARAGSKLYVSTRARGSSQGSYNGVPKVNEADYKLETVDFVLNPGFLEANPELAEEYNQIFNAEENVMSEKLMEQLTKENGQLKGDLATVTVTLENANNELVVVRSENQTLKQENDRLLEAEATLKAFEDIGMSAEELKKVIQEHKDNSEKLKKYEEIDTPEDINNALDLAEAKLDEYLKLGLVEEISQVLDAVEAVGSIEEINALVDIAEKLIAEKEANKKAEAVESLAKEFGIASDVIGTMYEKMGLEEVRGICSKLANKANESTQEEVVENEEDDADVDVSEVAVEAEANTVSRASRLMKSIM